MVIQICRSLGNLCQSKCFSGRRTVTVEILLISGGASACGGKELQKLWVISGREVLLAIKIYRSRGGFLSEQALLVKKVLTGDFLYLIKQRILQVGSSREGYPRNQEWFSK